MSDVVDQMAKMLLPCPFCGTVKVAIGASQEMEEGEYIEDGRQWSVLCSGCGASCSLYCECADEAATAWNMRALPDAAQARIREATEIVDLYFSPWGAAKAAKWERLSGDKPFDPETALHLIQEALTPEK